MGARTHTHTPWPAPTPNPHLRPPCPCPCPCPTAGRATPEGGRRLLDPCTRLQSKSNVSPAPSPGSPSPSAPALGSPQPQQTSLPASPLSIPEQTGAGVLQEQHGVPSQHLVQARPSDMPRGRGGGGHLRACLSSRLALLTPSPPQRLCPGLVGAKLRPGALQAPPRLPWPCPARGSRLGWAWTLPALALARSGEVAFVVPDATFMELSSVVRVTVGAQEQPNSLGGAGNLPGASQWSVENPRCKWGN